MEKNNYLNIFQADKDLPLLAGEQKIIDESDSSDLRVSNNEFMEAIFSNLGEGQRPLICGFKGHPGEVDSGKWFSRSWERGETSLEAQENNYFTVSSVNPDSQGKYKRKKINFAAQYVIVLDDIGTKIKGNQLRIPPTWILETSPGNYQLGYALREPIVDGVIAERLMDAIIDAGLCDPGASGPMTRMARLPVGINGKHTPPFTCRLRKWRPDNRYNIKELCDGFGLNVNLIMTPEKQHIACKQYIPPATGDDDRIYIPRKQENPAITKLKEKGLYIKPLANGLHSIKCPWQHEHTDGKGGGTAYFEPCEDNPTGGFVCQHAHCKKRHMRELRDFLGISMTEAANRPIIRIRPGCLHKVLDCFERELASIGYVYQRAGIAVYIGTDPGTRETAIRPMSVFFIARLLSKFVIFERFDKRIGAWVIFDPPYRHCRNICESEEYRHLPVLKGLARQPYLRPNGSLMLEPGYDEETGLYGNFDKKKFSVSEAPSRQEAEVALATLDTLFSEFSFKTESDKSAALSACLTATIRLSLPFAPMCHWRAHQIASGKSYGTSLVSAFATASPASVAAFPSKEEECQKLLLASLIHAPAVICFDNSTTDLFPHKTLCSVLTEEFITGRILGVSKMISVSTRILFLSSGNNVGPIGDMSRRTVTINLAPQCETPAARLFKHQPLLEVRSRREYYVSLVLTIIRAWIVAGRPCANVAPVATYTEWSDLCRQPLLWLGYPDPAESIFLSLQQDPDRETLGRLLHAWHDCFHIIPKMLREAISMASQELFNVFIDIAGEHGKLNNKRLGRWISRNAGRIVDGLKFERDSGTRSAEAWRVETVK